MPLSGHLKIFLNCINNIKQMALQARVFQVWHFCLPLPLFFLCSLALQLFVLPLHPSLRVFSFTDCSLSRLDFCLIPSHVRMHTHFRAAVYPKSSHQSTPTLCAAPVLALTITECTGSLWSGTSPSVTETWCPVCGVALTLNTGSYLDPSTCWVLSLKFST